ncbi:MAG: B12-binding domain-containing radical SAM protein [Holophagales bacterium]|nr:B12-binding domain-containing radical SAM protein [Holophagales bacterium]
MRIKFILPALTEATSPFFRPIKYSLFPPLGLATLAAYCAPDDELTLVDEHVESPSFDDEPDLVVTQVYITNAHRAYEIADLYRSRGCRVALGGLHVTALPEEAAPHADAICLGPGEEVFPRLLADLRAGRLQPRYVGKARTLIGAPPVRRDLIERSRYLVPNSLVVSRGCPHHCDFCYKDAFFEGGKGFYTQTVDDALAEIDRLPGRHLYFLDDHLLGHQRFARALFSAMRGMGRLFQGASTVDAILRGDTIELAAEAGLRSVFVGFESLSDSNLRAANKTQNLDRSYRAAIRRLHDLGISINGSFVFGLDDDHPDVFPRTVEWAVSQGLTTATFHIATPYPGTAYFDRIEREGRLRHRDWRLYDTRHAVFAPEHMSPETLETGYWRAYREFYRWSKIARAASQGGTLPHRLRRFAYSAGWKKFEPLWDLVIRAERLARMLPLLEMLLDRPEHRQEHRETAMEAKTAENPV